MKHELNSTKRILNVTLPGDVLSTNIEALRKQIFDLLASEPVNKDSWETLEIDLTAAKMVDSMGLNFLVALLKHVQERKGKMAIKVSSTHIHRTLLFTRLDKQMDIQLV